MTYRNGTYVAFDGNGTTDPSKGDMKYYGLLRKWNESNNFDLTFSDSHQKTYQVKDSSSVSTLKARLLERMKNYDKALDYYKIPLIIAYAGFNLILNPASYREKWPKALLDRIDDKTAKCIHIPFKEKAISSAVSQFSVHSTGDNILTSPLTTYKKEVYIKWGYIDS